MLMKILSNISAYSISSMSNFVSVPRNYGKLHEPNDIGDNFELI